MTPAEKWRAVDRHRSLIRSVCRSYSLGNHTLAERMQDRAADYIVRYHRRSPNEAAAIVQLAKWACLYILRRDRESGRAAALHEQLLETIPAPAETGTPSPELRAVCDTIEAMSARDRALFRTVFEQGETWTEAVRRAGFSTKGMQNRRDSFLARTRRAVQAALCARCLFSLCTVHPSPLSAAADIIGPPALELRFAAWRISLSGPLAPARYTLELFDDTGALRARGTLRVDPLPPDGGDLPPDGPVAPILLEAEFPARYHDLTEENQSATGRDQFPGALDIEPNSTAPGFCVGFWQPGEWMEWDFAAPAAGRYRIAAAVGAVSDGASVTISIDDAAPIPLEVPNTGGWHAWQDVTAEVDLAAGAHRLRITGASPAANTWIGNLDRIIVALPGTAGTP